ncbi:hypothetical protein BFJ69_g8285 [Fusarium oxysporum]|uniref:Uncharacterized protein n=1 Tax=Fusarium oxysporum TaxID=5507 RepID=A0A420N379_FUSOX|nr:hypothetical protein BFJ69_g8285 [Fusarium oxysporum]
MPRKSQASVTKFCKGAAGVLAAAQPMVSKIIELVMGNI